MNKIFIYRNCKTVPGKGNSQYTVFRLNRNNLLSTLRLILLLPSMALWMSGAQAAQTLDEAIREVTAFNCSDLRIGGGDVLGQQLNDICEANTAGFGTSAGGGGATTQSSTTVLKRLKRLRSDAKDGQHQSGGNSGDETLDLGDGVGLFFSAQYEDLERQVTTFENGYDSTIWGFTAGADARITDWFRSGVAFNYNRWDAKYRNNGGSFDIDSYGPVVFASLTPGESFFADLALSYTHRAYDRVRFTSFTPVNATTPFVSDYVTSDSGGDELGAALSSGYDFHLGSFSIGPRLGFQYTNLVIDGYTENGNTGLELEYDDDIVESLRTAVGLLGTASISTSYGVIVPQINAEWVHEFMNDQRDIGVNFAQDLKANPTKFFYNNERPDRDYFNLGAGVSMVLPNGIQPYLNFQALVGHSYLNNYVGTVGARFEF